MSYNLLINVILDVLLGTCLTFEQSQNKSVSYTRDPDFPDIFFQMGDINIMQI